MIIRFRKLSFYDIEKLGNLLEANNRPEVINFFYPFPMTRETAQNILHPIRKDLFFAALIGDKPIGMSMLRGTDEGFEIPSFGIFIDYLHQGKGYGKRLTKWTLGWADYHQIKKVRLAVHESNLVALKIYQSLGFIKSNETKDASGRTLFVMYRNLNNAL